MGYPKMVPKGNLSEMVSNWQISIGYEDKQIMTACRCFLRSHRLSECMQLQYKLYMIMRPVCVVILTAVTSGDPMSIADHELVAIFLLIRIIECILLFLLM